MTAIGLIVIGVIVVSMVIMAVFLLNVKGAFLIAGYNTMSKTERAKYNEKALCRFTGWLLIALSFCMLLIPAGIFLEMPWLIYRGVELILVLSIGAVIYSNTGNHFRLAEGDNVNESENAKPLVNKKKFALFVGLTAVPLIASMIIFYWGSQEPTVNILDDIILIEGMYGVSIDFYNVYDISLIDESMDSIGVGTRTNGFGGFGDSLKGDFTSGWLFVQSKSSPTIRIELAYERPYGKYIYISFRDSEATENLYREITERVAIDFVK